MLIVEIVIKIMMWRSGSRGYWRRCAGGGGEDEVA